jgi:hypothetical protein
MKTESGNHIGSGLPVSFSYNELSLEKLNLKKIEQLKALGGLGVFRGEVNLRSNFEEE